MEEEEIIALLKKGNRKVFSTLFEFHYHPLCAYIRTLTGDLDSAEEIVQKVFIILWQKKEAIGIHTSIKGYLYKTAYNTFLHQCRQQNKKKRLIKELQYEALQEEIIQDEETANIRLERLRSAIEKLPPRCKEVLLLRQQGLKYKEIAEELEISVKSVETQIRIAFKRLKNDLSSQDFSVYFISLCFISRKSGLLKDVTD